MLSGRLGRLLSRRTQATLLAIALVLILVPVVARLVGGPGGGSCSRGSATSERCYAGRLGRLEVELFAREQQTAREHDAASRTTQRRLAALRLPAAAAPGRTALSAALADEDQARATIGVALRAGDLAPVTRSVSRAIAARRALRARERALERAAGPGASRALRALLAAAREAEARGDARARAGEAAVLARIDALAPPPALPPLYADHRGALRAAARTVFALSDAITAVDPAAGRRQAAAYLAATQRVRATTAQIRRRV